MPRRSLLAAVFVVALASELAGSCSNSTQRSAERTIKHAAHDVTKTANEAAARVQAEAFRGAVLAKRSSPSRSRSIDTLQAAARDIPDHSSTVVGIEDKNGDGLDDDGLVQIESNQQAVCVRIALNGDIKITDNSCF